MNAVEFFFALSAVTFMTTIIYAWTRFVYKLDEQGREEPPRRETSGASRHSARDDEHFAGLGVKPADQIGEQGAALQ